MIFYVIWFLERCICRKNQPMGGCLRRGLVFVAYPHPRWGYPRAPVRPRIAGGAVYYTHKYKLKRGREDRPKQSEAGYYPAQRNSQSIDTSTFFVRCRKFCRKTARLRHVYDSELGQMPQPAQATRAAPTRAHGRIRDAPAWATRELH